MSVTSTVKDTARATLAEARKPFYASLAVTEMAARKAKETAKELPTVTLTEVGRFQARAAGLQSQLQTQVKELPAQAKDLRGSVTALSSRATSVYSGLATHGEKVFATVRKQPVAEQATTAGKTAAARARSARGKASGGSSTGS